MTINKQSNRGFTIIELLVVIIVIGVLTVLTMVIYSGIQAKVLDLGLSTDIDRLNALELKYKSEHGSSGRAFYTGDGVDSEMNFIPNNGNIFDVVTDATDYCIRGYNLHGTKDSIYNAYIKESNPGACDRIPPSTAATVTPSTPAAPVMVVGLVGDNVVATITPVNCDVGVAQYSINSRTDDGTWEGYTVWSEDLTATRTADEGVKYGYQAQARCYISYTGVESAPAIGIEYSYTRLYTPSAPTVTVTQNAGNIIATITPVTCTTGTIQYATNSQINGGTWTGYTAWSSSTTASQAATGGEGVKYTYLAQTRCYIDTGSFSSTSTGAEGSYISPITAPAASSVSSTTTPGYTTTYTWGAASCAAGTTARYQYKLTVAPSGYDSGWAATAGLSAAFTTSTGDQTYTLQVQGQCYNTNATSGWSTSGSTSYYCVYDSLPIATSISGYWSTAPTGYMLEDGSAISRTIYSDLFAAIGTTYGVGDGSTTFNLPNSMGRATVNKNSSDGEFDVIGEKSGEKTHVISVAELPSHNHSYTDQGNFSGPDIYVANAANYWRNFRTADTADTGSNGAHNTIQPSIVKVSAIKYRPATASDATLSASTSITGYFATAPAGYLYQDGSAVSRTTYSDLFTAIGTTYGVGDGSTTFNLPDSRGRVAVNKNPADTQFDVMGEKYGEKYHVLTTAEMPAHHHSYTDQGNFSGPTIEVGVAANFWNNFRTVNTANTGSNSGHNTIQPSIVKLTVIKYTPAAGSIDTTAKGTSISGYWSTVPSGYLFEDGTAVSRATYSDLFAVVGVTYGVGDGSTTFNLPDSRGRVTVNKNSSDAEFATIGQKYGTKTHTLSLAEMAAHHHSYTDEGNFTGASIVIKVASQYWNNFRTADTADTGGNGAHNNIQPSIVQNFAIRY